LWSRQGITPPVVVGAYELASASKIWVELRRYICGPFELTVSHATITPNFPSGYNHEIVEDYVKKNVGPPFFTLSSPKILTDGAINDRCDQPLNWTPIGHLLLSGKLYNKLL
jgi:hypothetical protein